VDLFESIKVCDTDLSGRQANYGTILFVERVNVEDSLASDNGPLEAEMCEASVPGPGKVSCGTCKTDVEELGM
jgi:hypothetical protein